MQLEISRWTSGLAFAFLANILSFTPALADWRRAETDNFIVYSELRERELSEFVTDLERFDRVLRQLTSQPENFAPVKLQIVLLRNPEDVVEFTATNSGVHYSADTNGPFLVAPRRVVRSGPFGSNRNQVVFHQYVHHFVDQFFPASYPAWYIEGLADLYSTIEFSDEGTIDVGRAVRTNANALGGYEREGIWIPMRQILSDEYANHPLSYLQGWLLTHRAMFDRELGAQLEQFLRAINEGKSGAEAYQAIFAGRDPSLDSVLRAYLARHSFPFLPVNLDLGSIAGPAITRMSDEDADVMLLRFRAADSEFEDLLADLLQEHPENAPAYVGQARLRMLTDDLIGANDSIQRALTLDDGNLHAHLFAANIALSQAIASDDPESGYWQQVRDHALRANRIDPDNATALVLYFYSYPTREGRPENAVPALERAFALVPQNSGIRIILGSEYLQSARYTEARNTVWPLARSAHVSSQQGIALLIGTLAERGLGFERAEEVATEVNAEIARRRAALDVEGPGVLVPTVSVNTEPNYNDLLYGMRRGLFINPVP